jgi:hypothetical protein
MKYEPSPGALKSERSASPPKYRAGTVSPLTTATRRRQRPSRFAVFVSLREYDREFISAVQTMTPSMLVSEVNSVRNYWNGDLYSAFRVVLKTLIRAFRGGMIPDPFDNQKNLIAGVASQDWYADRLEKIIEGMDGCADGERQDEVRGGCTRSWRVNRIERP